VRRSHDLLERAPAGRSVALETGQLRLNRDAGRASPLDQIAAVSRDLPDVERGCWVESEANLAVALLDERR